MFLVSEILTIPGCFLEKYVQLRYIFRKITIISYLVFNYINI